MSVNKFLNLLNELKSNLETKKTTGANPSGISHANMLIDNGKVIEPSSWNPPSAEEQNVYIQKNGMMSYGKWFLGIDANADKESKAHWHYIFTSDFVNVDRAGLIAIRQRAGQQHETAIFEAAGKMLEKIDK